MRSISERDLSVLIPLLAEKLQSMDQALRETEGRVDDLSDEELDERVELQDLLAQYDQILDTLRLEYETGLAEGINLPSYETLTRPFDSR